MKKKRVIAGVALIALWAILMIWFATRGPSQLLCEGKPIRAWILEFSSGDPHFGEPLKALGPAAVNELITLLHARDTFWQTYLWPVVKKAPAAPQRFLRKVVPPPDAARVRAAAAQWLGRIGPPAAAAVPSLAKAVHDSDLIVSRSALTALGRIGKPSVPYLMEAMQTTNILMREGAISGLAWVGADGGGAVPLLMQALQDPKGQIRATTASTLSSIGAPAVPALPLLTQLTTDSDSSVRFSAKAAVAHISATTASPPREFTP